ncbi:MAG: N-acetyltransferase [Burkholderiales bacterium]|nr:N-acetyltransferase [Anaerolineae bacterium]
MSETPTLPHELHSREATTDDAAAIVRIYNQGIQDRIATFETKMRDTQDVKAWFDGTHPIVVVVDESGAVYGFAATSTYSTRECYAGIAEFSVYVEREMRGHGAGRLAMEGLLKAASAAGFLKLLSRVFPENVANLSLLKSLGFREVGTYQKHAQLDGVWRDVVIVERLIGALAETESDAEQPTQRT